MVGVVQSLGLHDDAAALLDEIRLRAVNDVGDGAESAMVEATVPDVPGRPGKPSRVGTATRSSITIEWTAPSSTGGAAITDYIVQYRTSGSWTTVDDGTSTNRTATVTQLAANTDYEFRVTAVNMAGPGSVSSTSDKIKTAR